MWNLPEAEEAKSQTRAALKHLLLENEEWLVTRILHYATLHDFTRFTSTLKEAWRASIEGLSNSILTTLETCPAIPEFGPEDDWLSDPCGKFGRIEAQKHRTRGITLAMYMALMKYYRQSYCDLLQCQEFSGDREWAEHFVRRVFDRIEISFALGWNDVDRDQAIIDLQEQNRVLANEKNKFLTLFESLSMPCFLVNSLGHLDCMNLSAAKIFGYGLSPGEMYYRAAREEGAPHWLQDELIDFSRRESEAASFEKNYGDETECNQTFEVHFQRMLDVSGKYSGTLVTMADITIRIKAQQEMEEAHRGLTDAQEQMLQREKMAAIGCLTSGMAHEINNPLAVMLQQLQVIEQRLNPEFARNASVAKECGVDLGSLRCYLERQQITNMYRSIMTSGNRAATIVQKLYGFSHRSEELPVEVDLVGLLGKTLERIQEEGAYGKGSEFSAIRVERNDQASLPRVTCRPFEIQQVFQNILENGVQAMAGQDSPPRFKISIRAEGDMAVVDIADNGPGISEELRQKIFDPFFTTKALGDGLGLGLSMAYKIIRRHAGQLHVSSALGKGSTFSIKLPFSREGTLQR